MALWKAGYAAVDDPIPMNIWATHIGFRRLFFKKGEGT